MLDAAHEQTWGIGNDLIGNQAQMRETLVQRLQGDTHLQTCQRSADTEMNTVAEGHVAIAIPQRVQHFRMRKESLFAIGRRKDQIDHPAWRYCPPPQTDPFM